MERLNHFDLRLRCAASNDDRQARQCVDFGVGHRIELFRRLDKRLCCGRAQRLLALGQDADLARDGCGGRRVITSEHVYGDTGALARLDGSLGLRAGRIVDGGDADKVPILLAIGTVNLGPVDV